MIDPQLKRIALFRGMIFAVLGGALLVFTCIFISFSSLQIWGFPLLIFAIAFISIGLLPYRRLTRLEMHPYRVTVQKEHFIFFAKGKPLFACPLSNVCKSWYCEDESHYGICLSVDKAKLVKCNPNFNLEAFIQRSIRKKGCDLFLPYFKEWSF